MLPMSMRQLPSKKAEPETKKRVKAKGPNPLSVRKKQKERQEPPAPRRKRRVDDDDDELTRKSKRLKRE